MDIASVKFVFPAPTVALERSRSSWIFITHAKTQGSSWYKDRYYTEWLDSGCWHQIPGLRFGPLPLSNYATLEESLYASLFICT